MDDLRTRFGQLVAAHRRRRSMTQDDLASAADLSIDMISKIEGGRSGARFAVVERLAVALQVDPGELFLAQGGTGSERRGPFADLATRLVQLPDEDLRWVEGILEAALRPRR